MSYEKRNKEFSELSESEMMKNQGLLETLAECIGYCIPRVYEFFRRGLYGDKEKFVSEDTTETRVKETKLKTKLRKGIFDPNHGPNDTL